MDQRVLAKCYSRFRKTIGQERGFLANEPPCATRISRALTAGTCAFCKKVSGTLTGKLCENRRNIYGITRRASSKRMENKEVGYKPGGSTIREVNDRPIMWRREIRITARAYKTCVLCAVVYSTPRFANSGMLAKLVCHTVRARTGKLVGAASPSRHTGGRLM